MVIIQKEMLEIEEEVKKESGEEEKELDLGQTGTNLWNLITLAGPAAEYESVL
jgi:hypothetical protein